MCVFFLDSENVGANGLLGIETLTEKDEVIIFYYDLLNAKIHDKIYNPCIKAKITLIKSNDKSHLKNAMDFEIVAYAGYLIGKNIDEQIIILSNDKGYISAIKCLEKITGYKNILLKSNINNNVNIKNIKSFFTLYQEDSKYILNILFQSKNLNQLHALLCKHFKIKGPNIYKNFINTFSNKEIRLFLKSRNIEEFKGRLFLIGEKRILKEEYIEILYKYLTN